MLPNEPIVSVTTGLTPGPGSIIETLVNALFPLSYLITILNLNIHKHIYIYIMIPHWWLLMRVSCFTDYDMPKWNWWAKVMLTLNHRSVYIDMYTLTNITFFLSLPLLFDAPPTPSPKPHYPTPPTQNRYTCTHILYYLHIFHCSDISHFNMNVILNFGQMSLLVYL